MSYVPPSFNTQACVDLAESLLCADETLMALKVLEMVPSYYRDNPIPKLEDLKKEIHAKIATAAFYATHKGFELTVTDEHINKVGDSLRSMLIGQDIRELNAISRVPHLIDMGPGEGILPVLLRRHGLKFTYQQIYVNHPTYLATRHRFEQIEREEPMAEDSPVIFVATEIIEHLHDEREIAYEMQRTAPKADVIHVSTPLHTFNPNVKNWRDIGWLGHLRAYTPREFQDAVLKMFKGYEFAYYESTVQHLRLVNPNTRFDAIKKHYQLEMTQ